MVEWPLWGPWSSPRISSTWAASSDSPHPQGFWGARCRRRRRITSRPGPRGRTTRFRGSPWPMRDVLPCIRDRPPNRGHGLTFNHRSTTLVEHHFFGRCSTTHGWLNTTIFGGVQPPSGWTVEHWLNTGWTPAFPRCSTTRNGDFSPPRRAGA